MFNSSHPWLKYNEIGPGGLISILFSAYLPVVTQQIYQPDSDVVTLTDQTDYRHAIGIVVTIGENWVSDNTVFILMTTMLIKLALVIFQTGQQSILTNQFRIVFFTLD